MVDYLPCAIQKATFSVLSESLLDYAREELEKRGYDIKEIPYPVDYPHSETYVEVDYIWVCSKSSSEGQQLEFTVATIDNFTVGPVLQQVTEVRESSGIGTMEDDEGDYAIPSYFDSSSIHIVSVCDNKIIGYLVMNRKTGHICEIAVLPDYQKQGVGRAMFHAAVVEARKEGITTVSLSYKGRRVVNDPHSPAGFYERMGREYLIIKNDRDGTWSDGAPRFLIEYDIGIEKKLPSTRFSHFDAELKDDLQYPVDDPRLMGLVDTLKETPVQFTLTDGQIEIRAGPETEALFDFLGISPEDQQAFLNERLVPLIQARLRELRAQGLDFDETYRDEYEIRFGDAFASPYGNCISDGLFFVDLRHLANMSEEDRQASFLLGISHEAVHEITGLGDKALHPILTPQDARIMSEGRIGEVRVTDNPAGFIESFNSTVTPDSNLVKELEKIAASRELVEDGDDAIDRRPVDAGLLHEAFVWHDMAVKNVVNPNDEKKVAIYGGAGVDVSNFLLSTNATSAYFVSGYHGLSLSDLEDLRGYKGKVDSEYLRWKSKRGYVNNGRLLKKVDVLGALAVELESIGVDLENILVFDDDGYPRIEFEWTYIGGVEQTYSITFVNADITEPKLNSKLNKVLSQGVDIYYQKAGCEIPICYHQREDSFICSIHDHLNPGGYFVTDDYAFYGGEIGALDFGTYFPVQLHEIEVPNFTELEDAIIKVISSSLPEDVYRRYLGKERENPRFHYGWHVRIRQKEGQPGSIPAEPPQAVDEIEEAEIPPDLEEFRRRPIDFRYIGRDGVISVLRAIERQYGEVFEGVNVRDLDGFKSIADAIRDFPSERKIRQKYGDVNAVQFRVVRTVLMITFTTLPEDKLGGIGPGVNGGGHASPVGKPTTESSDKERAGTNAERFVEYFDESELPKAGRVSYATREMVEGEVKLVLMVGVGDGYELLNMHNIKRDSQEACIVVGIEPSTVTEKDFPKAAELISGMQDTVLFQTTVEEFAQVAQSKGFHFDEIWILGPTEPHGDVTPEGRSFITPGIITEEGAKALASLGAQLCLLTDFSLEDISDDEECGKFLSQLSRSGLTVSPPKIVALNEYEHLVRDTQLAFLAEDDNVVLIEASRPKESEHTSSDHLSPESGQSQEYYDMASIGQELDDLFGSERAEPIVETFQGFVVDQAIEGSDEELFVHAMRVLGYAEAILKEPRASGTLVNKVADGFFQVATEVTYLLRVKFKIDNPKKFQDLEDGHSRVLKLLNIESARRHSGSETPPTASSSPESGSATDTSQGPGPEEEPPTDALLFSEPVDPRSEIPGAELTNVLIRAGLVDNEGYKNAGPTDALISELGGEEEGTVEVEGRTFRVGLVQELGTTNIKEIEEIKEDDTGARYVAARDVFIAGVYQRPATLESGPATEPPQVGALFERLQLWVNLKPHENTQTIIEALDLNEGDPVMVIGPYGEFHYVALAALGHPVLVVEHPEVLGLERNDSLKPFFEPPKGVEPELVERVKRNVTFLGADILTPDGRQRVLEEWNRIKEGKAGSVMALCVFWAWDSPLVSVFDNPILDGIYEPVDIQDSLSWIRNSLSPRVLLLSDPHQEQGGDYELWNSSLGIPEKHIILPVSSPVLTRYIFPEHEELAKPATEPPQGPEPDRDALESVSLPPNYDPEKPTVLILMDRPSVTPYLGIDGKASFIFSALKDSIGDRANVLLMSPTPLSAIKPEALEQAALVFDDQFGIVDTTFLSLNPQIAACVRSHNIWRWDRSLSSLFRNIPIVSISDYGLGGGHNVTLGGKWILPPQFEEIAQRVLLAPSEAKHRILSSVIDQHHANKDGVPKIDIEALMGRTFGVGYVVNQDVLIAFLFKLGLLMDELQAYPNGITYLCIVHPSNIDENNLLQGEVIKSIRKLNGEFQKYMHERTPRVLVPNPQGVGYIYYTKNAEGKTDVRATDIILIPSSPIDQNDFIEATILTGSEKGQWQVPNLRTGSHSFVGAECAHVLLDIPAVHDGVIASLRMRPPGINLEAIQQFVLGEEFVGGLSARVLEPLLFKWVGLSNIERVDLWLKTHKEQFIGEASPLFRSSREEPQRERFAKFRREKDIMRSVIAGISEEVYRLEGDSKTPSTDENRKRHYFSPASGQSQEGGTQSETEGPPAGALLFSKSAEPHKPIPGAELTNVLIEAGLVENGGHKNAGPTNALIRELGGEEEGTVEVEVGERRFEVDLEQAVGTITIEEIRDVDTGVRDSYMRGVFEGHVERGPTVEALIGRLEDRDWRIRERAAQALGKLGDEKAVPPLRQILQDPEWRVRERAREALIKMGYEIKVDRDYSISIAGDFNVFKGLMLNWVNSKVVKAITVHLHALRQRYKDGRLEGYLSLPAVRVLKTHDAARYGYDRDSNEITFYLPLRIKPRDFRDICWLAYGEWVSLNEAAMYDSSEEYRAIFSSYAISLEREGYIDAQEVTGKKILDVGTGPGIPGILIAAAGAKQVDCIDVSSNMLDFARREAGKRRLGNIRFIEGSAFSLPFEDNSYDCVFVNYLFQRQPEYLRRIALREIRRVLKPGGKVKILDLYNIAQPLLELDSLGWDENKWLRELLNAGFEENAVNVSIGNMLTTEHIIEAYKPGLQNQPEDIDSFASTASTGTHFGTRKTYDANFKPFDVDGKTINFDDAHRAFVKQYINDPDALVFQVNPGGVLTQINPHAPPELASAYKSKLRALLPDLDLDAVQPTYFYLFNGSKKDPKFGQDPYALVDAEGEAVYLEAGAGGKDEYDQERGMMSIYLTQEFFSAFETDKLAEYLPEGIQHARKKAAGDHTPEAWGDVPDRERRLARIQYIIGLRKQHEIPGAEVTNLLVEDGTWITRVEGTRQSIVPSASLTQKLYEETRQLNGIVTVKVDGQEFRVTLERDKFAVIGRSNIVEIELISTGEKDVFKEGTLQPFPQVDKQGDSVIPQGLREIAGIQRLSEYNYEGWVPIEQLLKDDLKSRSAVARYKTLAETPDRNEQKVRRYLELTTPAPPIVVVYDIDRGAFRVLDGRHRIAVASLKRQDKICARIISMPSDSFAQDGPPKGTHLDRIFARIINMSSDSSVQDGPPEGALLFSEPVDPRSELLPGAKVTNVLIRDGTWLRKAVGSRQSIVLTEALCGRWRYKPIVTVEVEGEEFRIKLVSLEELFVEYVESVCTGERDYFDANTLQPYPQVDEKGVSPIPLAFRDIEGISRISEHWLKGWVSIDRLKKDDPKSTTSIDSHISETISGGIDGAKVKKYSNLETPPPAIFLVFDPSTERFCIINGRHRVAVAVLKKQEKILARIGVVDYEIYMKTQRIFQSAMACLTQEERRALVENIKLHDLLLFLWSAASARAGRESYRRIIDDPSYLGKTGWIEFELSDEEKALAKSIITNPQLIQVLGITPILQTSDDRIRLGVYNPQAVIRRFEIARDRLREICRKVSLEVFEWYGRWLAEIEQDIDILIETPDMSQKEEILERLLLKGFHPKPNQNGLKNSYIDIIVGCVIGLPLSDIETYVRPGMGLKNIISELFSDDIYCGVPGGDMEEIMRNHWEPELRTAMAAMPVDLENLKDTDIFFLEEDVRKYPDEFRQALDELQENEHIVVMASTGSDFTDFCLDQNPCIDISRFTILTRQRLEVSDFDLNQAMVPIIGMKHLQCIPLTDQVRARFPALSDA